MAVLLKDVAKDAGVAPATVSSILNKRSHCWASKETIKRVEESAKRLGYTPNRTARALRMQKFSTLGLIVPDLRNPFFAEATQYCVEAARKFGYDVIVEDNGGNVDEEHHALQKISERQVDGILCFPINVARHRDLFEAHTKEGRPPIILIDAPLPSLPIDIIETDFSVGLRQAIKHLIGLGHRQIAFLSALPPQQESDGDRGSIIKSELARHGIPFPSRYFIKSHFTVEDAHRSFAAFLQETPVGKRPTALIAINDLGAIGAMRAALDIGLTVPGNLSVIGIDDIAISRFLPISLTTIAQPLAAITEKAVALLVKRLGDPKAKPEKVVFPTNLVVRQSTGPVPAT